MNEPLYSFIYVNFQSARVLEDSLVSLAPVREEIPSEIIVVNNDPLEEEELRGAQGRIPFTLLSATENKGFGSANNRGARVARGKYLVFLNPDTRYREGDFHGLGSRFETVPRAIIGLSLLTHQGLPEAWSRGVAPDLKSLILNKTLARRWGRNLKLQPLDWVSGAALAIPKMLFEELEGFDESFFLYFEDVDLCLRAKQTGASIEEYPMICFFHQGGHSHPDRASMKKAYFESQQRYFAKHRPKRENFLLSLLQPLYSHLFR